MTLVPASSHSLTTGSIALANLVDPGAGKVVGSAAGVATAVQPPGFEIGYTQVTANANITDTLEATATALISPGALTFDGAAVLVQFFCASVQTDSNAIGDVTTVTLWEGATQIGRLAVIDTVAASVNKECVRAEYRFTPTAGAHTYKVCAFVPSVVGTPTLAAGAAGVGTLIPAFVRFVKV